MKTRRHMFMTCTAAMALLCSLPPAIAANPSYERGIEATNDYRYSDALMHFMAAAEQGDKEAQRNLGLMLLYGDRLYNGEISRNRAQAKRWLEAAANQGCQVSAFMLKMMAQHGG